MRDNNVNTSNEMWGIANARRAQTERDDRLYEFCMRHGPVSAIISKVRFESGHFYEGEGST